MVERRGSPNNTTVATFFKTSGIDRKKVQTHSNISLVRMQEQSRTHEAGGYSRNKDSSTFFLYHIYNVYSISFKN